MPTPNRNRLIARVGTLPRVLDRRGARWLLVVPASIAVSAKYRTPCLVYWRRGAWIHRYPEAAIPHASLGRAAPPAVLTTDARDIFLYGYTPRTGDTVFDVGAGIGAETLLFSRLVGKSGRVVSLEPHPGTFERLVRLCAVNKLGNVTPLQIAATDRDGETAVSDLDNHLWNTVLDSEGDGINVAARRIDSIARELGIERVDLLKMNIEGAERLAIAGLEGVIARTRHACISCHDFVADNGGSEQLRTKALVRDFLHEHGFRVQTRDDAPEPWTRDYVYATNERFSG